MTWSETELLEAYSAAVGSRTPGNRRVTQSVKSLGTDGRPYQWSGGRDCPRAGSGARPPRTFDTECPALSGCFAVRWLRHFWPSGWPKVSCGAKKPQLARCRPVKPRTPAGAALSDRGILAIFKSGYLHVIFSDFPKNQYKSVQSCFLTGDAEGAGWPTATVARPSRLSCVQLG